MALSRSSQINLDPGHENGNPIYETWHGGCGPQYTGPIYGNVYSDEKFVDTSTVLKQSLGFPEMNSRYYDIPRATVAANGYNTCGWLFEDEKFKKWQNSGGIFVVKGKPGSGKSTLMRHCFDQSRGLLHQVKIEGQAQEVEQKQSADISTTISEEKKHVTLSFFAHGRGTPLQKTRLGFYRTVLFQLLDELCAFENKPTDLSRIEKYFKRQFNSQKRNEEDARQWETAQLAHDFDVALREVLKENRHVYLYVDALDECGEEDARHLAETFQVLTLEFSALHLLHICISCRHDRILMLKYASEIYVEEHNREAIQVYIKTWFYPFLDRTIRIQLADDTASIFLWAGLAVEQARSLYKRGVSKRDIAIGIAQTPGNLKQLCEDRLESILNNEESSQLMKWICFAESPIHPKGLGWAMFIETHPVTDSLGDYRNAPDFPCDCVGDCGCDLMERKIKNMGHGLIEITGDENNRVVRFIHPFVQDFLCNSSFLERSVKKPDPVKFYKRKWHPSVNKRDDLVQKIQFSISQTCITYCNTKDLVEASGIDRDDNNAGSFDNKDSLTKDFPFLEYAVTSFKHADDRNCRTGPCALSQRQSEVINLLYTRILFERERQRQRQLRASQIDQQNSQR